VLGRPIPKVGADGSTSIVVEHQTCHKNIAVSLTEAHMFRTTLVLILLAIGGAVEHSRATTLLLRYRRAAGRVCPHVAGDEHPTSDLPLRLRGGGRAMMTAERAKVKADLEAMDIDKDGTITMDEYVEYEKMMFYERKKAEWEQEEAKIRKRCDIRTQAGHPSDAAGDMSCSVHDLMLLLVQVHDTRHQWRRRTHAEGGVQISRSLTGSPPA
jgi:hypothetical protein